MGVSISSPSIIVSNPTECTIGSLDVIVVERRVESSTGVFLKVDVVELGELGLTTIPAEETVIFEVVGFDV